ncbi:MAG: hypothetical protein OEW15_13920 [Nitrospirota bacterium]|nr:hypothetical protein [Nitrospirota bacterium]
MSNIGIILGIGLGVAIFGSFILLDKNRKIRRRQEIAPLAERLGFSFKEYGNQDVSDRALLKSLEEFELFSGGGLWPEIHNLMRGSRDGMPLAIFDYRFQGNLPSRKNTTITTTVFCADVAGSSFPACKLTPRSGSISTLRSSPLREISSPALANLAEKFELRGEGEEAVARLLTPEVQDFLLRRIDGTVEARGGRVVLYRYAKTVPQENIRGFLGEGLALGDLLRRAQEQAKR